MKCKIKGCARKYHAKGLCSIHYSMEWARGNIGSINRPTCSIENCSKLVYAKKYCRQHYANFAYKGNPLPTVELKKKCAAPSCLKMGHKEYCKFHQLRKENNIPFDAPRGFSVTGNKNIHWKGGISEYKNHYQMKKIRKSMVERFGGKCQECGDSGKLQVHHIDENKSHHDESNFLLLCYKCHNKYHSGVPYKKSKFKDIYGMTLSEMSKILLKSPVTIMSYHKRGILSEKLSTQLKNRRCN